MNSSFFNLNNLNDYKIKIKKYQFNTIKIFKKKQRHKIVVTEMIKI